MKKRAKKLNQKVLACRILVIVVLLLSCLTSGILAKYAVEREKGVFVGAANFYFRSDLLKEEEPTYMLNAGTDTIEFVLYNYADSLRISEVDIQCSVTASNGLTVQMQGADGDQMAKNAHSQIRVIVSGFKNGNTYTVKATGTGGFVQVLSATFTVREYDTGFYKYVDTSNEGYVTLNVLTGNTSGTVTFDIPTGLIPDRRDELLENVTTTVTFDLGVHSSRAFKFIIPNNYEDSFEFTVTLNGTIIATDVTSQN